MKVTRLQIVTAIVKPMATLIITRRLYIIASLQSVEPYTKAAVCHHTSDTLLSLMYPC